MRTVPALAALLAAAALAAAQEGKPKAPTGPQPRYGVAYRAKGYPQATPKEALGSVIAAADRGDFDYLVAHLLDPGFVDARVGDRARQLEPAVAAELARQRDFQLANPDRVPLENRVPVDAGQLRDRALADARTAAFRQLVRDVRVRLGDDPEVLKDLRRFYREGTFPDPAAAGDTAKVGLPDVRDRAVFLKQVEGRWFVENRQAEEKAPQPKTEPDPKKEPEPKKD